MSLNPVKVIKSPDTYFETLSGEVRKRYLEKIKIINNYFFIIYFIYTSSLFSEYYTFNIEPYGN